jgi:hypothetical protein
MYDEAGGIIQSHFRIDLGNTFSTPYSFKGLVIVGFCVVLTGGSYPMSVLLLNCKGCFKTPTKSRVPKTRTYCRGSTAKERIQQDDSEDSGAYPSGPMVVSNITDTTEERDVNNVVEAPTRVKFEYPRTRAFVLKNCLWAPLLIANVSS